MNQHIQHLVFGLCARQSLADLVTHAGFAQVMFELCLCSFAMGNIQGESTQQRWTIRLGEEELVGGPDTIPKMLFNLFTMPGLKCTPVISSGLFGKFCREDIVIGFAQKLCGSEIEIGFETLIGKKNTGGRVFNIGQTGEMMHKKAKTLFAFP